MKRLPILALLLAPLPAGAQAPVGDVALGRSLAETWCAQCHLVPGATQSTANDAAPSFPSIAARRPDAAALRTWLSQQHRDRMPNYHPSRAEVEGLVAYLLSLRR